MALTDTALRSAKPQKRQYKLYDEGGLFVIIAPSGGKWWRLKYRYEGKEKLISLGTYPAVSLKDARKERDRLKEQLAKGIDPSLVRQEAKQALAESGQSTFETLALEWFNKQKSVWKDSHARDTWNRLNKNLLPQLGKIPIRDITPTSALAILKVIEKRGAHETTRRVLQICSQIFRYAIACGKAEYDVTYGLKDALAPVVSKSFASITEPEKIGPLLKSIDGYWGHPSVKIALQLLPYLFVRSNELVNAKWEEINFNTLEWRIPASRMKMNEMHIVPLAKQPLALLKKLHDLTGGTVFLFPSLNRKGRTITGETLLSAIRSLGYGQGVMTIHGFRHMAATLLNEQGYNRDWIERQLAHAERNKVRATYNYAEYLPERKRMMQEWADYLDGLKEM